MASYREQVKESNKAALRKQLEELGITKASVTMAIAQVPDGFPWHSDWEVRCCNEGEEKAYADFLTIDKEGKFVWDLSGGQEFGVDSGVERKLPDFDTDKVQLVLYRDLGGDYWFVVYLPFPRKILNEEQSDISENPT